MHGMARWAVAALLALAGSPALAQTSWPEKPVKLVVGFTAGSATDVTGRMFAQKFGEAWGLSVIVDNVSGTPQPILDKVRAASLKVLADPEMQAKFANLGLEPVGSTGAETRAAIAADILKWAKVIEDAHIKPAN